MGIWRNCISKIILSATGCPTFWSWKEEDEVAVFIDNYGDVIRKEDLDFWKLDIYLDEDNCYQSHSKTEYCWGLWHILQSKTDK